MGRFARVVRTASLFSALTFVQCTHQLPLAEKTRTPADLAPKKTIFPHACSSQIIEGGLPAVSYIILQWHIDTYTDKFYDYAIRSQVFQVHLIRELAKRYGVRKIFLEGIGTDENLGEFIEGNLRSVWRAKSMLGSCQANTAVDFRNKRTFLPNGPEDFCFGLGLIKIHPFVHYVMLALENPEVSFSGFEKNKPQLRQFIEWLKMRRKLEENPKLIEDPEFKAKFDELSAIKYVERGIYAIEEVLANSDHNTAIAIGAGHRAALVDIINGIPYAKRPTFALIGSDCYDDPHFAINDELIGMIMSR